MASTLEMIFEEYPDEVFLKVDGYDDCVIGVSTDLCLVYDQELIIHKLSEDMDIFDAMEYFTYNIAGSYMGEQAPIFVELKGRFNS